MLQDYEILNKLKSDKEQGLEALFARYYRPLVVFADCYLHHLQESEDLVQEQMVKLWQKHIFQNITSETLSSFLFTVVKNACINELEKKKLPLTSLDFPHFQIAFEEAERMDETAAIVINQALQKLPEKTRLVVEQVMLKDKTYKEAAETLGISVNTLKTLLKQGMKELRESLKDKQAYLFLLYMRGLRKVNLK